VYCGQVSSDHTLRHSRYEVNCTRSAESPAGRNVLDDVHVRLTSRQMLMMLPPSAAGSRHLSSVITDPAHDMSASRSDTGGHRRRDDDVGQSVDRRRVTGRRASGRRSSSTSLMIVVCLLLVSTVLRVDAIHWLYVPLT